MLTIVPSKKIKNNKIGTLSEEHTMWGHTIYQTNTQNGDAQFTRRTHKMGTYNYPDEHTRWGRTILPDEHTVGTHNWQDEHTVFFNLRSIIYRYS